MKFLEATKKRRKQKPFAQLVIKKMKCRKVTMVVIYWLALTENCLTYL